MATILQYWVQRYEDKMAKLINDIVNNKPPPSPNKRKRNQGGTAKQTVTLDQLLAHLNHLRIACDQQKFFNLPTMQGTLSTAHNQCSETQKKTYKDLFGLIVLSSDEDKAKNSAEGGGSNSSSASRSKTIKRGRKPKVRKKQESESEEESTEEEDIKKPARKRKKNNNLFTSDSDWCPGM